MKLKQVEIENFRCFERLTLSLEEDVTAIIGINAAGKTALLDAIAFGLRPLLEATSLYLKTGIEEGFPGRSAATGAALSSDDIHLGPKTTDKPELRQLSVTVSATSRETETDKDDQDLQWKLALGPLASFKPVKPTWLKPERLQPTPFGLVAPGLDDSKRTAFPIPNFAYYRESRNCPAGKQPRNSSAELFDHTSAYRSALDASADFDTAQRWFYTRENQELRTAREKGDTGFQFDDLVAIRKALNLMLENVGRIYADDDPPRMKVRTHGDNGSTVTLDLSQLSAGQRNLLTLTLDFARRLVAANSSLDQPLEAPGILLIDEIELNLHPKWQQTVIPHLRRVFPNTQIIVATHSPVVLSTLEKRQIRVLRDQQLFTPSVETYGTDTGRVQRLVMDTETRPPDNPVTERIDELFAEIADDHLEDAVAILAELQLKRDSDDPTLIEARELIEMRKWEKEVGL